MKFGVFYINNGFWDMYKMVYFFYFLIVVEKYEEMLEGFLNSYRESGYLLKWLFFDECGLMFGILIDVVIVDVVVKDIWLDLM